MDQCKAKLLYEKLEGSIRRPNIWNERWGRQDHGELWDKTLKVARSLPTRPKFGLFLWRLFTYSLPLGVRVARGDDSFSDCQVCGLEHETRHHFLGERIVIKANVYALVETIEMPWLRERFSVLCKQASQASKRASSRGFQSSHSRGDNAQRVEATLGAALRSRGRLLSAFLPNSRDSDKVYPTGSQSSCFSSTSLNHDRPHELERRFLPGLSSVRYFSSAVEKAESADGPAEQFQYQAEVSRLLNLIVHSLYSHKEVFLRELVSNASDALDKLRFLSVTDPSLLGNYPNLEIKIKANPEEGTLTIIDSGIGMTREELIQSLGTIAESGTAKFLKALKENPNGFAGDSNLIGQFGVGFYSAFLVAEKVVVMTRKAKEDKCFVWTGQADSSSYAVSEETDPENSLPRGTSITLHLKKEDKHEYSDLTRIQNLVKNYSQFLSFPIYILQERSRTVDDALAEMDAESEQPAKPKENKSEKYYEWELVNETKPIWLRSPKEVTKDEYDEFYKKTFNEFLEPMAHSHFSTEGEVEFKSLLYIPPMGPATSEELLNPKTKNIRLYVKRVFISDEFDGELFPRYLGFVKGVVDSNDLPLNVSREILQQSHIVRVMKKRLVRKTFDMMEDMAKNDDPEVYKKFWTHYGKYVKLGCIEDSSNHKRLGSLLRFFSSKHDKEMTSLQAYTTGMKTDQKNIYYIAADSVQSAKNTPFLEDLLHKDIEVLFLVEPIDEVAVTNLQSFKGKKFVDISKEELGDEESKSEEAKDLENQFNPLCEWMKSKLGDKIEKVQVSKRSSSSYPCVLTSGKFGFSPNMERIMRAQALGDANPALDLMRSKRVLEINPNHPLIKDLNGLYSHSTDTVDMQRLVEVLFETAVLASGFTLDEPATYGSKVYGMLGTVLERLHSGNQTVEVKEAESEIV